MDPIYVPTQGQNQLGGWVSIWTSAVWWGGVPPRSIRTRGAGGRRVEGRSRRDDEGGETTTTKHTQTDRSDAERAWKGEEMEGLVGGHRPRVIASAHASNNVGRILLEVSFNVFD